MCGNILYLMLSIWRNIKEFGCSIYKQKMDALRLNPVKKIQLIHLSCRICNLLKSQSIHERNVYSRVIYIYPTISSLCHKFNINMANYIFSLFQESTIESTLSVQCSICHVLILSVLDVHHSALRVNHSDHAWQCVEDSRSSY